jgi:nucleotide-binding universal stress UspA family protein
MQKILVTTDFSTNSKMGIRFAVQLAAQTQAHLTFYHVIQELIPTTWSQDTYNVFARNEIERHQKMLQKFIEPMCKKGNLLPTKYACMVEIAPNVDSQIIAYAKQINADFICMSTRGAGTFGKLFGTNASALITTSSVPVIVVPHTYRIKKITNIWYASDLENFEKELNAVDKFAALLSAKIDVIHYSHLMYSEESAKKLADITAKYKSGNISFHYKKFQTEYSLTFNLQRAVKSANPSLLILFTKQNRGWFDRLFLSSKSAEMTYNTTTPMLVFPKS